MKQSVFTLNLARLVTESGKDASPEASFLMDFDHVCKKMNSNAPHYYFKKINREDDPEYFDVHKKSYPISCVVTLPEPSEDLLFDKTNIIYHTNDQEFFICQYYSGKPSTKYKPSSMHCMRNMYFQATEQDIDIQEKSGDKCGILESGTDRHKRIQHVIASMSKYGVDCEFIDVGEYVKDHNLDLTVVKDVGYETKLFDEKRNIVFLCDGLIKYKGEYYILEIKTESQYKFGYRSRVDDSHKYQAWTYSLELGIDKVLFIYENRDICTKKSYILEVSDADRQFIEDRVKKCSEYVSNKTVPPRDEDVPQRICNYCDYRTSCRACGDKNEENKSG